MRTSVSTPRRGARLPAAVACALVALLTLLAGAPARARASECPGADAAPSAATLADAAGATICLLDAERTERGRGGLVESPALDGAARAYSARMVAQGFFAHVAPDGSSLVERLDNVGYLRPWPTWLVGENLAWGRVVDATPRTIVAAWMASPAHRRNVLSRAFEEVGVGIVLGVPADAGGGATYTAEFGRAGPAPGRPAACGAPGWREGARCWCRAPRARAARRRVTAVGRPGLCAAGLSRSRGRAAHG